MPIEFRCTNCSKLLRTADESAGKQAKCPQCGTIVPVPATGGGEQQTQAAPESPANDPLGTAPAENPFGGGGVDPFAAKPSGDANPYATPQFGTTVGKEGSIDEPMRKGLPWEAEGKSFRTFWETTKLILFSPQEAFGQMRLAGGYGDPMVFTIIGSLVGGLITAVYQTIMQVVMLGAAAGGGAGGGEMAAVLGVQIIGNFVGALIGGTIGAIIGMFIGGGIYHLFLMMLGGANKPFEATVRVVAFTSGAIALLQIVPLCGQLASIVWSIVCYILGLAAVHRISSGKSAAAVLLPIVVFGLCIGVAVGVAVFGIAAAANAGP